MNYEQKCHDYIKETIEKFQNSSNVQLTQNQTDEIYAIILNAMLKAKELLSIEN